MGFYDTGSSLDGQADNCQQNEGLTGGTKASDIHIGGTTEIEKMARIRPGFVARNRNFARLIIRSQTNMATGIKGYCFRTAPDASLSGHGENASTSSGLKIPGTSFVADREWEPSDGKPVRVDLLRSQVDSSSNPGPFHSWKFQETPFVVSLSNHQWAALRQAQGER